MRIGRARKILRQSVRIYRRRRGVLSEEQRSQLEEAMNELHAAIGARDRIRAGESSKRVRQLSSLMMRRTLIDHIRDGVMAILVALVVAVVVRQMWFEPMEIPSGSMRPTYKELDRLFVTKTSYGLNIPMTPRQFYFDPALLQRFSPFIFTSEDMDIPDQDTTYFFIPSKRRLIKRCMGKPGDKLYFYGGRIYGTDASGDPVPQFNIDSVPFISFEGKVVTSPAPGTPYYSPVLLYQMNRPVARLSVLASGELKGELFDGKRWVPEGEVRYSELFGMGNYAMAQLMTRTELTFQTDLYPSKIGDGLLYLVLAHSPSVKRLHLARDAHGRLRPMLLPQVSALALDREHLDRLFDSLYTNRFIVKNGFAWPDTPSGKKLIRGGPRSPAVKNIPNGRYEFEKGIGYSVEFGGIRRRLSPDHPLLSRSPENIQFLFNLGMEMYIGPAPSRFAWWRDGALYVMGSKLFDNPQIDWRDPGSPDRETIERFGLQLGPRDYLALGDNYAASSDSRVFGPVPQENIRGTPTMLIWPPSKRWGIQNIPPRPFLTLPRGIVWGIALISWVIYLFLRKRQEKNSLFKK